MLRLLRTLVDDGTALVVVSHDHRVLGSLCDRVLDISDGDRFDLEEFYRRVADNEGVTYAQGRQHARATMAAVAVAVTEGEFAKLATQLPDEYADLLQTEPVQHH